MSADSAAGSQPNFSELGIVAIGRNEGERLLACLASLQSYVENVIYVDSGSIDGSAAAAEQMNVSVLRLNQTQPFTAARARNEGFAVIKARRPSIQFVQFIDGDCEIDRDWLATALAFIEYRSDVAVVCGRRRERFPGASIYNRLCDMEWDTSAGEASACGGDSLVRVKAFMAIGGFRSQLIAGEEPELCVRLRANGWKIWRLDHEMTRHDAAIVNFGQWWTRTARTGYGYTEVSRLHAHSQFGIWKREIMRAVFWGGITPSLIALGALIHPAALLTATIYPLQMARIAMRRGPAKVDAWLYALFVTLAKFAELEGILKFHWRRWLGRAAELIEYKNSP